MAAASVKEPAFINYLLSPDLDHDCYFLVGNSQHEELEKIGVVKKMLLAHSVVLRTELQDSKMSEKGVVRVEDLYPDTFRNLLKFVYGYDNTSTMTFDEADNLLYAAEKYFIDPLKAKVATRLISLLNGSNIFSLMMNPACFKPLELESAISKILQDETENILANPLFLDITSNAFVKILEQDVLNVTEIELWRAALKWAKHKVDSEDVELLRKTLTDPMKHIRILTLDALTFCKEVMCSRVLTSEEVNTVCTFYNEGDQPVGATSFSCKTEPRIKPQVLEMKFTDDSPDPRFTSASFELKTKECGIVLMPLTFPAKSGPPDSTYLCECTIKITDVTEYATSPPITINFRDQVKYGHEFDVPITKNGTYIRFLPNKSYDLEVTFTQPNKMYCSNSFEYSDVHISIYLQFNDSDDIRFWSRAPIKSLLYRSFKP